VRSEELTTESKVGGGDAGPLIPERRPRLPHASRARSPTLEKLDILIGNAAVLQRAGLACHQPKHWLEASASA
jgi:hypothetical protein